MVCLLCAEMVESDFISDVILDDKSVMVDSTIFDESIMVAGIIFDEVLWLQVLSLMIV